MEDTPGKRFQVVRNAAGLTLMGAAGVFGCDKATVHRLEHGGQVLDIERIRVFTERVGFTADVSAWIAFGGDKPRELIKAQAEREKEKRRAAKAKAS